MVHQRSCIRFVVLLVIVSLLFISQVIFSQNLEVKVTKKPIPGVSLSKGKVAPIQTHQSLDEKGKNELTTQNPPADPADIKNQIQEKYPIEISQGEKPPALTAIDRATRTQFKNLQDITKEYQEKVKDIEPIFQSNSGSLTLNQIQNIDKIPFVISEEKPNPIEERTPKKGHFTVKIPLSTNIEEAMDSGNFILSSGSLDQPIPDNGYYWIGMRTTETLPSTAYVTELKYRLRIDDNGDSSSFYCGDYQIYLSYGSASRDVLVYDHLGERTDGGHDDDADDDSDIYLNWRSTYSFNGEDPTDYFYLWVDDSWTPDEGILNYIEFDVYWEDQPKPNLIADYTPSGWDYPIVPSSESGTHTVGPNLKEGEITYIDFAFINREADIPGSTRFYIYLYDGSDYLEGWYWDGLQENYYGYVTDYQHTFSNGNHTLKTVADANDDVDESNESDNEYSRTFYWEPTELKPNLIADYTPSSWDYAIIASSAPGTNSVGPDLTAGETTYIDFAFINRDADIPSSIRFYVYLYDGEDYLQGWYVDGLQQNYYVTVEDYEHVFSAGSHTLKTFVDATEVVEESNENDNEYSNTFTWYAEDPNLIADYTPSGWDGPIVASSSAGTHTFGPELRAGETTYIDFAFVNRNKDIPTGTNIWVYLYDGSDYLEGWYWDGLGKDYYGYVTDYERIFTQGTHTLRTEVDATDVVAESNENDNEFSHDFLWEAAGDPDIDVQPTSLTIDQTEKNTFNARPDQRHLPENFQSIPIIDSKYIGGTAITKDGKEVVKIIVPGKPPENYRAPVAQMTLAAVMLPSMPAYDWSFGCSATSAAMMAGYYDHMGYPDMYTGPTNGGLMPLDNSSWGTVVINGETRSQCPLSATRNGVDGRTIRGHVDDYWIKYGEGGPDPFVTNGWTEHTHGECTGDYMGTNQDYWGNTDGSTTFWYNTDGSPLFDFTECETWSPPSKDGCHGMRAFFESRGYNVIQNYTQLIYGYNGNTSGYTYEQYKQEIDAGRPVVIHVEGHTMIGVGYEDNSTTIYIHDTWDYQTHSMNWGESYSGLQQWGVSVVELEPTSGPGDYFTIYNIGSGVLTINAISNSKNWLNTTGYPALPFDIQPGNNQAVSVEVDWNLLGGQDQDVIDISSNDPDEPVVTVTVNANPTGVPVLTVNPLSYHAPASGGNEVITVTNSGTGGTFTWTALADQSWINVNPTTGSPGESFTITVGANSGPARSGTVTVTAPGADGSPQYVQVTQDGSGDEVTMWIDTDLAGPEGGTISIPIHVSDLTDKFVYSSDITITYDAAVLQAVDTDISGTRLEAAGWGTPTKNITTGKITMAMAGSTPLTGNGVLVKMIFNIVGTTGTTSPLHFDSALCNEGQPPVIVTDGFFTVMETKFDISGRVGYYSDINTPVGDVNVVAAGPENKTSTTLASGDYELLDLTGGDYTVTPDKSGSINSAITAYDASIILRYSVGTYNLMPYAKIAADVSGNGSITAYDASFILRYSVGVVTGFPVGSDWTFVPHDFPIDDVNWSTAPANRSYTPLDSDQPGHDYVGILYGDVSGNWSGARSSGTGALVEIGIDQIRKVENGNILIPLKVNFSGEAYSGSFMLKMNNSNLSFLTSSLKNTSEDEAFCAGKSIPQGAEIALASAHPLHQKGLALELIFKETNPVDISSLEFDFSDIIVDDRNTSLTVVKDESKHEVPKEWKLGQNHPNPFNSGTVINFHVPQASHVNIEVYNLLGQRLRILVDQAMEPGSHYVNWNGLDDTGRKIGSGIYLYKMRAGRFIAMKKMVLVQ